MIPVRERAGVRQRGVDVHDVGCGRRGVAGELGGRTQQPGRGGRVRASVVQREFCARRAARLHARDVQALAAVGEETFHRVRQVAMKVVRVGGIDEVGRVEPLTKPANVFAVARNQNRHVDGPPFRDTDHPGSTGTHSLNGLIAGINLFDINCRC